jgi:hypothetical protein
LDIQLNKNTEALAIFEIWSIAAILCLVTGLFSIDALYPASSYVFGLAGLASALVKFRFGETASRILIRSVLTGVAILMAIELTSLPADHIPTSRGDRTFLGRSWGAIFVLGVGFPAILWLVWVAEGLRPRR